MANPIRGLQYVVSQLRKERTNLVNQLRHADAALSVLGKLDGGRFYTQPRRGKMSTAARARIAAAQRARWAKARGHKVVSIASKSGIRTMSASARRKIAIA